MPVENNYRTKMIVNKMHLRTTMMFIVFTVICLAIGGDGAKSGVTVSVMKCCRIGESLKDAGHCEPGATRLWAPLVYAHRRHKYLPLGTTPEHWLVSEASRPSCQDGAEPVLIRSGKSQNSFLLFANGSLWLQEREPANQLLHPNQFCVDTSAAIVCPEREIDESRLSKENEVSALVQPKKKIKLKKCCGGGGAYSEKTEGCVWLGDDHPDARPIDVSYLNIDNDTSVNFIAGFPLCSKADTGFLNAGKIHESALAEDGSLQISTAGLSLAAGQFCFEHIIELKDDKSDSIFACSDRIPRGTKITKVEDTDIRFKLYPMGLVVSAFFLAATIVAGFVLPSSHHVLHWRCQTHYIACLLIGDIILAITQLAGSSISGSACVTMAILMHFFFLSAFFWLNTMCFNIWWTFRDFRPTSLEKSQELCRLRIYEVYAWGVPLVIAGVAAILDNLPNDPIYTFLRPRFGVQRCWFYGDMEILTYFFGPVGFLLAINLMLFASTTRQLTCGLWKREDVKSTTERAALGRVCMKLVVVMGVTWVVDVVSWAVGGPSYVWYITDLINALQGVFIFIVVGCQPQVWTAVKRIWCVKKFRSNITNTTGAPMHSSSQGLPSMGDSVTNNTVANSTNVKIPMETVC